MKRILLIAIICGATKLTGQTDRLFTNIDSLVQYQQFEIASNLLQQFIEEHPGRFYDHAQAYLMMSHIDLQLGNIAAALASNQKSMELRERLLTDDIAENYMQLGAIYLKKGEYDQALEYLNQAKELPLEDPQLFSKIYSQLAAVFKEKKDYDKGLDYLQQSLKISQIELGEFHPDVVSTNLQMAQIYDLQGKSAESSNYYKKAMSIELLRYFTDWYKLLLAN